jgi:hypothetical protein
MLSFILLFFSTFGTLSFLQLPFVFVLLFMQTQESKTQLPAARPQLQANTQISETFENFFFLEMEMEMKFPANQILLCILHAYALCRSTPIYV